MNEGNGTCGAAAALSAGDELAATALPAGEEPAAVATPLVVALLAAGGPLDVGGGAAVAGAAGVAGAVAATETAVAAAGVAFSVAGVALAVAGASRTQVMPELPTIAEAGPLPGYAVDIWVGIVGPAGLPRAVIERINAEVNRLLRDAEFVRDRLLAQGLDPLGGTPGRFAAAMKGDLDKYAGIARAANMKIE